MSLIYRPPAVCCKCGTRKNISPYMGRLLWICEDCAIKEGRKLLEKFKDVK